LKQAAEQEVVVQLQAQQEQEYLRKAKALQNKTQYLDKCMKQF